MAIAEGLEQGWLPRNVELVMHPENGLHDRDTRPGRSLYVGLE